jgi:hypothetical protein
MNKILGIALFVLIASIPGVASADAASDCAAAGGTYTASCPTDEQACGCHYASSGFVALAPIPGLTDQSSTSVINSDSLANFFNNLYKYLIGLAAILAVVEIIWGGLEYATTESIGNKEEGKSRIQQAIFGLILVLSPVLVFSIINPSILKLSLNLPKLDLVAPADTNGPSPAPGSKFSLTEATNTAKAAGCTNPEVGVVVCPNQEAANAFKQACPAGSTSTVTTVFDGGQEGWQATCITPVSGCSISLNGKTAACPTQETANNFAAACVPQGSGRTYLSNEASLPYAASCDVLVPFQGNRNYTDKTQIPQSYWCYTVNVRTGSTVTLTYICGADKNSCDDIATNQIRDTLGTFANGGQCVTSPF